MKEVALTHDVSFYDRASKKVKRAIGTGALAISLAACNSAEEGPTTPTPTIEGTQAVPVLPTEVSPCQVSKRTDLRTDNPDYAELPCIVPQQPIRPNHTEASD